MPSAQLVLTSKYTNYCLWTLIKAYNPLAPAAQPVEYSGAGPCVRSLVITNDPGMGAGKLFVGDVNMGTGVAHAGRATGYAQELSFGGKQEWFSGNDLNNIPLQDKWVQTDTDGLVIDVGWDYN